MGDLRENGRKLHTLTLKQKAKETTPNSFSRKLMKKRKHTKVKLELSRIKKEKPETMKMNIKRSG